MNQKPSPDYQLLAYADRCLAFIGKSGISKKILKLLLRYSAEYPIRINVHEGSIPKEIASIINAMNTNAKSDEEKAVLYASEKTVSIYATGINTEIRDRIFQTLF